MKVIISTNFHYRACIVILYVDNYPTFALTRYEIFPTLFSPNIFRDSSFDFTYVGTHPALSGTLVGNMYQD